MVVGGKNTKWVEGFFGILGEAGRSFGYNDQLKNGSVIDSLFTFKDANTADEYSLHELIESQTGNVKVESPRTIMVIKKPLADELLPNLTRADLDKFTFENTFHVRKRYMFGRGFAELVKQLQGTYIPNMKDNLFRNYLSKGATGSGLFDFVLKHKDKDGLITYHALDLFRGDHTFGANQNSAQRLRDLEVIDDTKLFSRKSFLVISR